MLTAAAAVLGMIPLVRSAFFGPMAVAMMGGILVATVLTLVFLPALYAAWFRVRRTRTAHGQRRRLSASRYRGRRPAGKMATLRFGTPS